MEAPTEAEIAARLERATRSALESSPLPSYSFSQSSARDATSPSPASLSDLLPLLGPPDASRCPSCRVVPPFGSRSHICLACNTFLLEPVVPSFTSSIAFRRLAEALHLDDLETDHGEVDEQVSDSDVDSSNKISSLSSPLSSGVEKQDVMLVTSVSFEGGNKAMEERTGVVLMAAPISYDGVDREMEQRAGDGFVQGGNKVMEERTVIVSMAAPISYNRVDREMEQRAGDEYVQAPSVSMSTSLNPGSVALANTVDHAGGGKGQSSGILDYAAKLEGISLEDFFSSQTVGQTRALANSDVFSESLLESVTSISVGPSVREGSMDSSSIHKESLFLDPLIDSSIPNDFDFMVASTTGNSSEVSARAVTSGAEDDDSSWEGEFQSAAPASAPFEPHSSGQLSTLEHFEDAFGGFFTKQESSIVGSTMQQGKVCWPDNGQLSLGLHTITESTDDFFAFPSVGSLKDSTERSMNDMLFGSGWKQSERPSATTDSFLDEHHFNQSERDVLEEPDSSYQMGIPTNNNSSFDTGRELDMLTWNDGFHLEDKASAMVGEKKKIVGSLLAQLHDLSFMLADKLVIKNECKEWKQDSPI